MFLHSSEPGHLALGKLVDGNFEFGKHFLITHFSNQMQRQVFVFQSVIGELFGCQALVKQALHLVQHAIFEPLFQPFGNSFTPVFPVVFYANHQAVNFRHIVAQLRVLFQVGFNFNGTNYPAAVFGVGGVMLFGFHVKQYANQLVQAFGIHFFPEVMIFWNLD